MAASSTPHPILVNKRPPTTTLYPIALLVPCLGLAVPDPNTISWFQWQITATGRQEGEELGIQALLGVTGLPFLGVCGCGTLRSPEG